MNMLNNERGNVLLYVLLTLLVLMIATPAILSAASTSQLANKQTEMEKKADDLALSGMEAFLMYLNQYPAYGNGLNRKNYFNKYGGGTGSVGNGWNAQAITMPEGTMITYEQYVVIKDTNTRVSLPLTTDNDYDVIFEARVNNSVHRKTIRYQVSAFDAIAKTQILTGGTFPLPAKGNVLYGENSNVTSIEDTTIKNAISDYIDMISSTTASVISDYLNTAKTPTLENCTGCTIPAIKNKIANSPNTPVILYRPGTLTVNGKETFGSNQKPVILIADKIELQNSNLSVYGNLIANGDIEGKNQNDIFVHQVNGQLGDLLVNGEISTETQTAITVSNTLYAESLEFKNNAIIKAKNVTVKDEIDTQTQTTFIVNPGSLAAGSIEVKNNAEFTVNSGDIFVEEDFKSGTRIELMAGGVIAVGEEIQFKNNSTVVAGISGQTSLHLSSGGSGGGDSTFKDWTPQRQ